MDKDRGSWLGRGRARLGLGSPRAEHQHPRLRRRISSLESQQKRTRRALESRLTDLEAGLQEQCRLSLRIAELSDIVTELVGAAARGGGPEFERVLDRYAESL